MKQRVFSTIIALLGIAAGAWAGELKIGGYALTPGDYFTRESGFYHLEGGSIEFTDATHVTFTNAELWFSKGNYYAISTDIPNLTITLVGTNTIQGAGVKVGLYVGGNTTITGDGSLEIKEATEDAIQYYTSGQNLIIDGATVKVKGARYGVKGSGQSSSFTMKGKARLDAWGDQYCFYGVQQLKNADVSSPSGATFLSSKFGVVDGNSEIIKGQWVTIQPGVAVNAGVAINETNFPDVYFRNWILNQDYGKDGMLTEEEIKGVTQIGVSQKGIANLKGIEFFTALTTLDCSWNELMELDVSKNTALTILRCHDNQLTALDVSNTSLTTVSCYLNKISGTQMDAFISSLPEVEGGEIHAYYERNDEGNIITTAQVRAAKGRGWDIKRKDEYNNNWIDYTGVTMIDETNFPDEDFRNWILNQDYGKDGMLTEKEIKRMTQIDVSQKGIANLKGIEFFTALTKLDCSWNKLMELDVSKNTALTILRCHDNQLTALDVSKNTALQELRCSENQLTALDVSQNQKLEILECYRNCIRDEQMTLFVNSIPTTTWSVEVRIYKEEDKNTGNVVSRKQVQAARKKKWYTYKYKGDKWVDYYGDYPVDDSFFPDVNFRKWILSKDYGKDGYLDDEEIADITTMEIRDLGIAEAKGIEIFTALTTLDCSYNQLTKLTSYVSKNTALTDLNCSYNQLTTLDVSKNTALTDLNCGNNQLASLDVSKNTALTDLNCSYNQLTTLDVSKNTALTSLSCSNNQLASLDVSKNTALTFLGCSTNAIRGEGMATLVNSLPDRSSTADGKLFIFDNESSSGNKITTVQVQVAKDKGWKVQKWNGLDKWVDYKGADPGILIDKTLFPDDNFRKWILAQSYGVDGYLDDDEIAAVSEIDVEDKGISDLQGIEYFTALTLLNCSHNELTALDVSKNTALEGLACDDNAIRGKDMDALIKSLPDRSSASSPGECYLGGDTDTGNKVTTTQVAALKAKGWKVQIIVGSSGPEDFAGIDFAGIVDGDANGDKKVDVADIVAIISHKKGAAVAGFSLLAADINNDGTADEKDIEQIKKMIMNE